MKTNFLILFILGIVSALGITSCDKLSNPEKPEPQVEIYLGYTVGDSGKIYKSINKGKTWTFQQSGTTEKLNSVFTLNENIAIAVGNNGLILKTTNGGNNWYSQSSGTNVNLKKIRYNNSNGQIWITGEQGVLIVSNAN